MPYQPDSLKQLNNCFLQASLTKISQAEKIIPMKMTMKALAVVFCSLIGCQSKPMCGDGYTITTSAQTGCRAPEMPGCAQCCTVTPSGCVVRQYSPGNVTGITPWYNQAESKPTCPAGCQACASCTMRDESSLCQMLATASECDCSKTYPDVDPCSKPDSCACYCLEYKNLNQICPSE